MAHFHRTKINDWVRVSESGLVLIARSALQPGMAKVFAAMPATSNAERAASRIRISPTPLPPILAGKTFADIVALLAEKLLAQSALTPGLSQVYMDSMTQSLDTNEIYRESVPERFIGRTYREIEEEIVGIDEKGIPLIGFAATDAKTRNNWQVLNHFGQEVIQRRVIINPKSSSHDEFSNDHVFQARDSIFPIAYEQPELVGSLVGKAAKK